MKIDENAPGNISQRPVTQSTDNETGFTRTPQELEGDLGHAKGDTKPLPASNEPLVPGAANDKPSARPTVVDGDQLTDVDQLNNPAR